MADLQQTLDEAEKAPAHSEPNIAQVVEAARPKVYSAPRRFDLPTIFVVTTAYSVLFAGTSALDWPAVASACLAGFVTLIGLSQALLFGGKRPREASILSGAALSCVAFFAMWVINGARRYATFQFLTAGAASILFGMLLGYLSGALVGGVFLVADVLRGRFRREGP